MRHQLLTWLTYKNSVKHTSHVSLLILGTRTFSEISKRFKWSRSEAFGSRSGYDAVKHHIQIPLICKKDSFLVHVTQGLGSAPAVFHIFILTFRQKEQFFSRMCPSQTTCLNLLLKSFLHLYMALCMYFVG